MIEPIAWLSALVLQYPVFQFLIIFLGAAFGGEFALFTIGFLTAQGILPILPLIILSFLGTLSSDILWFLLGKTAFVERMISHRYAHKTISLIAEAIDRVSRGNRFAAIVFAKFLAGTRILIIMYVSKNNLELKQFVRYDAIAIILWLFVVIPIGFIAGLGFTFLSHVLKNIYAGIGFVLLFIFIIVNIQILLKRYLQKKSNVKLE